MTEQPGWKAFWNVLAPEKFDQIEKTMVLGLAPLEAADADDALAVLALIEDMRKTCALVRKLREKMIVGDPLSATEFALARIGLGPLFPKFLCFRSGRLLSEHEFYLMLRYEDDDRCGIVWPSQTEEARRNAGLSSSRYWPSIEHSDVDPNFLQQEQRAFWEAEFPEDLANFKGECRQ